LRCKLFRRPLPGQDARAGSGTHGPLSAGLVSERSSWTAVMEPVLSSTVRRLPSALNCRARLRPPRSPTRPLPKPRRTPRPPPSSVAVRVGVELSSAFFLL
jgi:hypothetical protein